MKGLKRPWIAAVLALALGGPGCFYLGWRRGAKAIFGWLFGLSFAMASARLIEPAIFLIVIMHTYLAWRAYRSCVRTNATQMGTAAAVETKPKTRRSWKQLAWTAGKNVLLAVGGLALIAALFFGYFGLIAYHYLKMQRSVHPGMSIEQVLGAMHESGLVNGYPHQLDGDDADTEPEAEVRKHIVSLAGPGSDPPHGYSRLSGGPNEILSPERAAALLREQIMPGREYRIGFTFTPGYGAHWSMTVILDSGGKVVSVVPFRTWD